MKEINRAEILNIIFTKSELDAMREALLKQVINLTNCPYPSSYHIEPWMVSHTTKELALLDGLRQEMDAAYRFEQSENIREPNN